MVVHFSESDTCLGLVFTSSISPGVVRRPQMARRFFGGSAAPATVAKMHQKSLDLLKVPLCSGSCSTREALKFAGGVLLLKKEVACSY